MASDMSFLDQTFTAKGGFPPNPVFAILAPVNGLYEVEPHDAGLTVNTTVFPALCESAGNVRAHGCDALPDAEEQANDGLDVLRLALLIPARMRETS
jgi:hypothetical protein